MSRAASTSGRLLHTFVEELDERLRGLERDVLALERETDPAIRLQLVTAMFRAVHSLKGAAHAVGIAPLERLCHELESRLALARDAEGEVPAELLDLLLRASDVMTETGRRLRGGGQPDAAAIGAVLLPGTPASAIAREGSPASAALTSAGPLPAPATAGGTAFASDTAVRVDAQLLDAILARAGEVAVERRRLIASVASVAELGAFIAGWQAEWRAQRTALRQFGERGAAIASRIDERLAAVATLVSDRVGAAAEASRTTERVSAALEGALRTLQLLPFAEACAGLDRVVRDVAQAQGKDVRLEIDGGEVRLERSVIDQLRDVLRHLVRNAVDHGVETPVVRAASGKPAAALVQVRASVEGERVLVTVTDDGAGFDDEAVRAAAVRRGLTPPADRSELARLVLLPGFSTSRAVTNVSGRGVGLDAVRAAVEAVHGTIALAWEPARGSRCEVRVPVSLATAHIVVVRAGGALLAFPAADVRRFRRVAAAAIRRVEGRDMLSHGGERPIPIVSLAATVGLHAPVEGGRELLRVVTIAAAGTEVAFIVDETLAEQEVVVASPGPRLRDVPLLGGASVLETGEVVMILKSGALVRAALEADASAGISAGSQARAASRRRVLVVDDSATTRSLVRSILEGAGYGVAVATDGADAWAKLQDTRPDAVVSDVDMPRMDGFTLCETVRRSPRTRDLPFVLVTALASDRDRARGLQVGADAYVVKAQFDQGTLLETLQRLLA